MSVVVRVPPPSADDDRVIEWVESGASDRYESVEVVDYDLERHDSFGRDSVEAIVARLQLALDLEQLRHPGGSLLARALEERLLFWRAAAVDRS